MRTSNPHFIVQFFADTVFTAYHHRNCHHVSGDGIAILFFDLDRVARGWPESGNSRRIRLPDTRRVSNDRSISKYRGQQQWAWLQWLPHSRHRSP